MSRPQVLAHRGDARHEPENTLPAFAAALSRGADGIELDVRLSRDGVPMVVHDSTVDRTTDGQGRVSGLSAAELGRLRCRTTGHRRAHVGIPRLEEILAWAHTHQPELHVELKDVAPDSDEPRTRLLRRVVDLIGACDLGHLVTVSAFDPALLHQARQISPLKTALLHTPTQPEPWLTAQRVGASGLHSPWASCGHDLRDHARAAGLRLRAYTLDTETEIVAALDCDLDGFITSDPQLGVRLRDEATTRAT